MPLDCKKLKQKYEELTQAKEDLESSSDIEKSKKLKTQLEILIREMRDILKYPGFVYESFLRMKKDYGIDIYSIQEIKISSKGIVYGKIRVHPQIWKDVLFYDGKIVERLGGNPIDNLSFDKLYVSPEENKLMGIVSRMVTEKEFFVGDENERIIIGSINGKKVKYAIDLVISDNGDKTGVFYGENYDMYFFVNDKLFDNIDGCVLDRENQINNLQFRSDGVVCGTIMTSDDEVYPFCGDKIKRNIGGENFKRVHEFHVSPDGKMAGTVTFDGDAFYPFFDEEIIREIDGNILEKAKFVDISSDGKLFGKVFIKGFWYPFYDKKVIKKIGDLKIGEDVFLHVLDKVSMTRDGKMCGLASFEDEDGNVHKLPFFGDEIIREIGGIPIQNTEELMLLLDDTICGSVFDGKNLIGFMYDVEKYVLFTEIGK